MKKEFYNPKTSAYKLKYTHSLTFSGSIQPTEKWRMNFSGSVDLEHWKITQTSLSIYRDLHCWSLSASVSPFGLYKSFMVTIGANASMLRDLKYDKRSGSSANINCEINDESLKNKAFNMLINTPFQLILCKEKIFIKPFQESV